MARIGGKISVKIDGEIYLAKGDWDYNLGVDMFKKIVGADVVHGDTVTPQVPFIEGKITDQGNLDSVKLRQVENATVTIDLANGKLIALYGASWSSEGNGNTGEGEIDARFEGMSAKEIR